MRLKQERKFAISLPKLFFALIFALSFTMLVSCKSAPMKLDYSDESSFEQDLNAGENLKDKTVAFTVKKFAPESTFGYNLQAGEHLNFISPSHPDAKEGDSVKVKVKDVQRFLNSWLIKYEKL